MIKQNIEEVKKVCEDFNNERVSHLNVVLDNKICFSLIKNNDIKIKYDEFIVPSIEVRYKDTILNQIFDFDYIAVVKF